MHSDSSRVGEEGRREGGREGGRKEGRKEGRNHTTPALLCSFLAQAQLNFQGKPLLLLVVKERNRM